jgi:hypothetical protein
MGEWQLTLRDGGLYSVLSKLWRRVHSWIQLIQSWLPCGGGVEYLHRSPASCRRQRKGKSRIWDSKIWSWVSRDSDQRMTALARASSSCKRQTRPLVRASAPHQQTHDCLTVKKIWSQDPDGCFIPSQIGRLTVCRNIRLRLIREKAQSSAVKC